MSIKSIALAAALVAAVVTSANAASPNQINDGKFESGWGDWSKVKSSIGTLDGSNAAKIGNGTALGVIAQYFSVAADGLYTLALDFKSIQKLNFSITDVASGMAVVSNSIIGGVAGKFTTSLSLDADNLYSISFSSLNAKVDNVSVRAAVAVPGPEAGAGVGALAMGGAALWMARRRREAANAA